MESDELFEMSFEPIEISDDDECPDPTNNKGLAVSDYNDIVLISDYEFNRELPPVNFNAPSSVMKNSTAPQTPNEPSMSIKTEVHVSSDMCIRSELTELGKEQPIAGLKVNLPLTPYPGQRALLDTVKMFMYK